MLMEIKSEDQEKTAIHVKINLINCKKKIKTNKLLQEKQDIIIKKVAP
jgi:hypothetical protein